MLRLQEKPIEWIKFTAVMGLALNIPLWLLWGRGTLPIAAPMAAAGWALSALVVALIRPFWFRRFYRAGMTVSFHFGQIVGKVLLTLFFFLIVTPMGLLLRFCGKDLLRLKVHPDQTSHWHPAKNSREFDRMC